MPHRARTNSHTARPSTDETRFYQGVLTGTDAATAGGMAPIPKIADPVGEVSRSTLRFERVLVCLDRSGEAEAALPWVRYLAGSCGAEATLIHVLDTDYDPREGSVTEAVTWEIAKRDAQDYLDAVVESIGPRASGRVLQGDPARQIEQAAEELNADLTILTTHGAGGALGSWELGSAAQKILALSQRSVLIIPSQGLEPEPHVPPDRILVPLDGSPRTECVLPPVVELSRPNAAEVVLAHVVGEPLRTSVLSQPEDLELARTLSARLHRRGTAYLEGLRGRLGDEGVHTRIRVERSTDIRGHLASLVEAERPDLVAICAHGSICDARNPYGSVASYLLAHVRAPLLILQDLPPKVLRVARRTPESWRPPEAGDVSAGA